MRAPAWVAAGVVAAALAAACPARAAEPTDPIGRYNLACKHALAGERDAASSATTARGWMALTIS